MNQNKTQIQDITKLKNSATWTNLNNSFNAETRVNALYRLYADYARKSGDYTTGQKFETTAHNEFAHAKIWYEYIHPCIPTVEKNLEESATGEHYEWTEMYNSYADIARKEGFEEIATKFEQVAAIERNHEKAFTERKTKLENGSAYSSGNATSWICQNCGYQTTGTTAPEICPVCKHNRSYFLNVE